MQNRGGGRRGIQDLSLLLVQRFGHSVKSWDNSEVWIANKRERREILKFVKAVQQDFERTDPLYAVIAARRYSDNHRTPDKEDSPTHVTWWSVESNRRSEIRKCS